MFSTAADSQTSVEVHVLQGERPMARDNRTLGRFHLAGLPPAPRGVPQIEVTFDIDANGIVNVSAKDMATQKEQKIQITASSGLSKDEVDKMMREAESHAEDDKKRKEEIETRNHADQAVYVAEKMLRDSGEQLGAGERAAIESAVNDLKSAIGSNDTESIKRRMDALNQAQHKAAEAMYKNAQTAGASGAAGQPGGSQPHASTGSASSGDVIDAEVVEEEKK
jgi:molecular chaperone DnaK